MRPEDRDPAYLWDMLEAAQAAMDYITGLSLEEFLETGKEREITRLAVERQLEILGEAARRLSPRFREDHPELPWKNIVGLRNVISHEYDKVNYTQLYRIIHNQIPQMIATLKPIIPPIPLVDE